MSLNNVLARTDGALFSGPTFKNTIWTDLTASRDRGRRSGCRSTTTALMCDS